MPITQDRFMTVIGGAKRVLEREAQLQRILTQDYDVLITNANSAIAHNDAPTGRVIQDLVNTLTLLREVLFHPSPETMQLIAVVLAEELHFRKHAKRNQKSAQYRKFTRQQDGIMPRAAEQCLDSPTIAPIAEPTFSFEHTEEYKRFQAEMHKDWPKVEPSSEPEGRERSHLPLTPTPSQTSPTIVPQQHKDGTIRYLPDDTELNLPPNIIGKDLL